jgi:Ca2+-binding EF-hand superfamily protein
VESEGIFSPVDMEQLKHCFNEFDPDETGLIYCSDLYELVRSTGVEVPQEMVNEVISSLEADALTQISFPEFLDVLAVLTSP